MMLTSKHVATLHEFEWSHANLLVCSIQI